MLRTRPLRWAALAVTVLVATGCSSAGASPEPGTVPVVAATNVWGDIARQIGGSAVDVTSLIDDPSQDPHAFEPSGRDELAVSRARVVIVNGGGYDDVLDQMLHATDSTATVLDAVDLAGDAGLALHGNEHVWMDPQAVAAVADRLVQAFAQADPGRREQFRANGETFRSATRALEGRIDGLRRSFAGTPVAVTEPVPLPLVWAAGLHNVMPEKVTEAVEEGIDVAPSDLADAEAVLTGAQRASRARVFLYNGQSLTSQVRRLMEVARSHDIPTVEVSELLPDDHTHYQAWMTQTVRELRAALTQGAP